MKCPRGCSSVIRNHDEVMCLVHGTIHTPSRPWDVAETPDRYTWNAVPYVPFSDAERREQLTWREGDPIPHWLTANPTECNICGREMGAQGMPSHVRFVHGTKRRAQKPGIAYDTCPCCKRPDVAMSTRYPHTRVWCKQCDHGRHIDVCTLPARSEQDARKRGVVWS